MNFAKVCNVFSYFFFPSELSIFCSLPKIVIRCYSSEVSFRTFFFHWHFFIAFFLTPTLRTSIRRGRRDVQGKLIQAKPSQAKPSQKSSQAKPSPSQAEIQAEIRLGLAWLDPQKSRLGLAWQSGALRLDLGLNQAQLRLD